MDFCNLQVAVVLQQMEELSQILQLMDKDNFLLMRIMRTYLLEELLAQHLERQMDTIYEQVECR